MILAYRTPISENAPNQIIVMEITTAAKTLLEHKGRDIWTISPMATVYQAIQMMSEKNIGALPVMEGTKLVGMISERDYMSKVALKGKSSKETPVGDIMTRELVTVGPDQNISSCLEIITEHRIRHLPVVDGDKLLGIVSIGDLVKWVIATQRMTIEQLNAYISGGYSA
jgi:CBS domain-containing protein